MSTDSAVRAETGTATGHLVRPAGGGLPALFEYFAISARRYLKVSAFSMLGAPVLYMLSLGVGLGSLVNSHSGANSLGVSYLSFIAPALIAATALQVAVMDATYPILHGGFMYQRVYFAMNATPLSAAQISRGVLGWLSVRAAFSATLYLLVVAAFGGVRSIGAVLCVPIATLGGLAVAAPVAAYAASVQSDGSGFSTIFRFIVMPMFLFSGTFYPISTLPHWARILAWVSPLWHASELSRWVGLGSLHLRTGVGQLSLWMALVHIGFLAAPALAGAALTARRFRVRLAG